MTAGVTVSGGGPVTGSAARRGVVVGITASTGGGSDEKPPSAAGVDPDGLSGSTGLQSEAVHPPSHETPA